MMAFVIVVVVVVVVVVFVAPVEGSCSKEFYSSGTRDPRSSTWTWLVEEARRPCFMGQLQRASKMNNSHHQQPPPI
uniref:Putative secreted protein n=1 Tax=Anopheles darlingi TaxID=43151 RepID=A0A2M4DRR7_ANODA